MIYGFANSTVRRRARLGVEFLESRCLPTTITLLPSQDATLYEDAGGSLANGSGDYLFVGRTGPTSGESIRRALLRFDLDGQIPASATVREVTLELNMSRTVAGPTPVSVHRALASWGEGSSDAPQQEGGGTAAAPGDATWLHRQFPSTLWDTPGGDFAATSSATTVVSAPGAYGWSSAQMTQDVQAWLADPSQNFGWLLQGDESASQTAKRFDSRDNSASNNSPRLIIDFDVPEPAQLSTADVTAAEGNEGTTAFSFEVTLTGAIAGEVTVRYETSPDSAAENQDYHPASGILTFTPNGPRTQTISVPVLGDREVEPDETFVVRLSDPTGAQLQDAEAIGTIQNDDQPSPWRNHQLPEDVSGDGLVVPLDALLIINRLNRIGPGPLPVPPVAPDVPPPFFDVDGDLLVAPVDALLVINLLNRQVEAQAARDAVPLLSMEGDVSTELRDLQSHAAPHARFLADHLFPSLGLIAGVHDELDSVRARRR